MRRSPLLMIASAAGTLFFIIALIGYANAARAASASPSDMSSLGASLGASIAMTFMTPYIVTFGFGVAFGWLGWLSLRREAVMVSVALYAVALALAIGNFWLLVLPLVLTVLAFIVQWPSVPMRGGR